MTALIAEAADQGYRVIITLLGVTNLLLNQNRSRIESAFAIESRDDYRWVVEPNPSGRPATKRIADMLARGRVILVPVLKHAGRITKLADVLGQLDLSNAPVLIIDDEADQASLNLGTPTGSDSKTYAAITRLRAATSTNLYVQYTATPYAPLLINADDHLLPQFIEFLQPGTGYTGGREFFIDAAEKVVRDVPILEEQNGPAPIELPRTLVDALGSFVSGAVLLLAHDPAGTPVSMLVHSTQRNDIQERYYFLIDRQVKKWKEVAEQAKTVTELPPPIQRERARLVAQGAVNVDDKTFLKNLQLVLQEIVLWLVNSTAAVNKVTWNVAPIHILVGGNKLDRGFTVEGLTVTYMNRPPSTQIDTIEQRARAFGYRGDQLPYCQFFASRRTAKVLRDVVYTEYDLRARLQDHIDAGGNIVSWAAEVGLLLPEGTIPTRTTVVRALSTTPAGWKSLRRPSLDAKARDANLALVESIGLLSANKVDYGRLSHRTIHLSAQTVLDRLLRPWSLESYSPDWRRDAILDVIVEFVERHPRQNDMIPVLLMEDRGDARTRAWEAETGFINLFQGEDPNPQPGRPFYPGDRAVPAINENPDRLAVQVHRVKRRNFSDGFEILTLAVYLGDRAIVRSL
ncbi:MAG: hypothetical protein EXR68_00185 [Dehalococcoidia bacterium]|nr:hypothetical protein [Dehalococcoidia bacterium]